MAAELDRPSAVADALVSKIPNEEKPVPGDAGKAFVDKVVNMIKQKMEKGEDSTKVYFDI